MSIACGPVDVMGVSQHPGALALSGRLKLPYSGLNLRRGLVAIRDPQDPLKHDKDRSDHADFLNLQTIQIKAF